MNPYWAVNFFLEYKAVSFFALGMVVLSVTGAEALYADMGHFGKTDPPGVVYAGGAVAGAELLRSGALLLANPAAINNPFFLLAPTWALIHCW